MPFREFFILFVFAAQALALEKNTEFQYGAFLDTYYAFDFNQPAQGKRLYTTLPTHHHEPALNLAFIEGKFKSDKLRSRLALQTGSSVYANYAAEYRDPNQTGTQWADVLQHVQESVIGYQILPKVWIDAGIYLSHIGSETFISQDNWTYTRSLIADFSPYYEEGLKLSFEPNSRWFLQFHLLNGWQRIVQIGRDKALGTQIIHYLNDKFSISHNSFIGRETELRIFQDLILKYQISEKWESCFVFDLGYQRRPKDESFSHWFGTSFQNRFNLDEVTDLSIRFENYSDPEGIIVQTGKPGGFEVVGASVNIDRKVTGQVTLRGEFKWLQSKNEIFPAEAELKKNTLFLIGALVVQL